MYEIAKRSIDIFGSVLLGILFSPVCLLTAIAIIIDTRGPVFADTPERVGQNGRLFRLFKFRSMIVNAHQMLRNDPQLSRLYREYRKNSYKLLDDPRVTRVGRFIRKHSIDEIPQLFNVMLG